MRDKRQRLAPERFLDEGGIDIGDPVAEAFIGSRAAVMRLIGMQDVALAREAVPSLSPKVKGLDARKGNTDRVCVVAMRGKRLTMEMGLHAFDSLGSRRDFDAISATIAGTAYRAVGVATILLSIPHGAPLLVATSVIYSRLWHLGLQSLRRLTRQRDHVATSGRAGAEFWRLRGGDFHPSPARALFVVLPADSRPEVEAMVSNRDIGFRRRER